MGKVQPLRLENKKTILDLVEVETLPRAHGRHIIQVTLSVMILQLNMRRVLLDNF